MTLRVLFTGEGASDNGLVPHIEAAAAREGLRAIVTAPDFGRLPVSELHSVPAKLRAIRALEDSDYDLVIIHRDADRIGPQERRSEVAQAVGTTWPGHLHIAAVPVRALEAWLLLDEHSIRQVAENPNGKARLALPKGIAAERVPDPKKLLRESLATANGSTGRRLDNFRRRFPQHRHQLLERLDAFGPVSQLPSWQAFMTDLRIAFQAL
ncbi:hypothetical protein [Kitasatospora sp. NBC_00458]|uniref:hypothetical protein n=1 Tax=Kitasatospora sp. NBC_00458 TaxID=2903568 RepID=UPI002E18A912